MRTVGVGDPSTIIIDTSLALSPWHNTDEPTLVSLLNEPEIAKNTLMIPHPYLAEHAREWLELNEKRQRENRVTNWAIRLENQLIGSIGYVTDSPVVNPHKAEIGYWLGKAYWGKGLVTRSVQKLTELLVEKGFVRITAGVFAGNDASVRVLEKSGFKFEAKQKKFYCKNGIYLDALTYVYIV